MLVERGEPRPDSEETAPYEKFEHGGFVLYIRTDMRFEGDAARIDRKDYRGGTFLLVTNGK